MNDIAIDIVRSYIKQDLIVHPSIWEQVEFQKLSYSRWAAYEILNLLMDHPEKQPMTVIENFYLKMIIFTKMGAGTKYEEVFTCAEETANQILLLFV